MSWALPIITLLSFLRIPIYGVLPIMWIIAGITLFVVGLYRLKDRLDTGFKLVSVAAIGLIAAIGSYLTFTDPLRVAVILIIPVVMVSCGAKGISTYLFAILCGLLPVFLDIYYTDQESPVEVLRRIGTISALATFAYLLIAHIISNTLISELHQASLREKTIERTDSISGGLNEFALREKIDSLLQSNEAPILRLYKLYLPELDAGNSIYSRELRQQLAIRLAAAFKLQMPTNVVVGRLNIGTFVVIAKRSDWSEVESALRNMRSTHFDVDQKKLQFDPVIVTTDAPIDGKSSEQLLDNLARVLERAKRDRLEFARYLPIDQALLDNEYLFVGELGQAMELGDLQLYLQAKVDTRAGNPIIGAEALIRWHHPSQGLLSPAAFLPQIENSNARTSFALFVIRRAAEMLNELRAIDPEFELSFNLSAYDLHELRVLAELQRVMETYKFKPRSIQIEISESETTIQIDYLKRAIQAIRDLGYSSSLDDFGTGMCSLAYFSVIPVDTVKVDRSFLGAVETSDAGKRVLASIVDLCKGVGCTAVVEGVETQEQADLVTEMGFDRIQGYFFGKPVALESFKTLLQQQVTEHERL